MSGHRLGLIAGVRKLEYVRNENSTALDDQPPPRTRGYLRPSAFRSQCVPQDALLSPGVYLNGVNQSASEGNLVLRVTRGTHTVGPLPRATRVRCTLLGPDFHRRVPEYPRHTALDRQSSRLNQQAKKWQLRRGGAGSCTDPGEKTLDVLNQLAGLGF